MIRTVPEHLGIFGPVIRSDPLLCIQTETHKNKKCGGGMTYIDDPEGFVFQRKICSRRAEINYRGICVIFETTLPPLGPPQEQGHQLG